MEHGYSEKGDTWPKVLKYNHEKYGARHTAMRHKHYGIWQPYTWKDYYLKVKSLSLGLLSLGLKRGDKVLVVGDNTPEWHYAELAAQAGHALSVGAYSDLTPKELEYISKNSEAAFAVVQDQEQVDKLLQVKDALPNLKKVIFWNYKGMAHYKDPVLAGFREVVELGEKYGKENPSLFEQNVESGKADDPCAIVYTSGTRGEKPKGAVHTYRTLMAGAVYHLLLDPWHDHDNVVPYLSPVWINEQWLSIGCHLLSGSTINFAESSETQLRDAREIGPTIVFRGARLWESQAAIVRARISRADLLNQFAFRVLMPAGERTKGRNPGRLNRISYSLVHASILSPIKRSLGLQNARICYTTGAILSPEAFKFYHALNLPLKNLYGSTEGGSLTGAKNDAISLETVGFPHKGAEVKIAENGEIVYRQPGTFVGYYNDPERTKEVLKDGWFHSGDCGYIREDGQLVFVDRVDDLIRTANGESLAPQLLESRLRFSPYIKDAWILGSEEAFVSAIIVVDYDHVRNWAGERRIPYSNFIELSQRPEVYELIKQDIDRVNRTLPPSCKVMKYVNLHKEFDPDEGELTRNRKLRRAFLKERYRRLIDAIYSGRTEAPLEARVEQDDERMGKANSSLRIQSVEGVG